MRTMVITGFSRPKKTKLCCLFVMTLLMLFMANSFCVIGAHAAQSAVTSVSLTEDAQSAAGESVLADPLCRTDGGQLLLSYASGDGAPVTGLVVGYRNEGTVTVNGAVYQRASDADLRCGVGAPAFLTSACGRSPTRYAEKTSCPYWKTRRSTAVRRARTGCIRTESSPAEIW